MSARDRIERFVFGKVAAVRPYLLLRGLLVLLALDCVVDLVPHGGRYGVGGFNVAHFAFLDAVQPLPTAAVYVGVLFACALLALTQALSAPTVIGMSLLTALYTYAWSMSLLDAYQHHYLLSLLLASAIFFPQQPLASVLPREKAQETEPPPITVKSARKDKQKKSAAAPAPVSAAKRAEAFMPTTSAFGYVSFCVTCVIVYFYTAITKLEPDFRSGAALSRIVSPEKLDVFRNMIGEPYLESSEAYRLLAWGAIALQLITAAGILVALTQDRRRRGAPFVALLGLAPIAFHVGASTIDLEIGWFGRYMVFIHFVLFAPAPLLGVIATGLDAPRRLFASTEVTTRFESGLFAVLGLAVIPVLYGIDLPGVAAAAIAGGAAVALSGAVTTLRGAHATSRRLSGAALVAALVLRFAVTHPRVPGPGDELLAPSAVRYDFYRFVGGDHRRRGELADARDAYEKARAYAPDEETRERMTSRLRSLDGRERATP